MVRPLKMAVLLLPVHLLLGQPLLYSHDHPILFNYRASLVPSNW